MASDFNSLVPQIVAPFPPGSIIVREVVLPFLKRDLRDLPTAGGIKNTEHQTP